MPEGTLTDIDELVLTVRNRNSREYISEAVNDYRARSLRSAIAATWVAITYDIISKIRELALQGDGEAIKFSTQLDRAIALRVSSPSECKKQLQAIEGQLLTLAHQKFEFLSDQEFRDMERLYEDRNLCAHPALAGDDLLFQPAPELVRTYIVQAISHLLQHPPVQGKTALARLKADLLQASFPSTQAAVITFLNARYLRNIKAALVDNIVTVLLKAIIHQVDKDLVGRELPVIMTLVAVSVKQSECFSKRMHQELPKLCDGVDDDALKRAMRLFSVDRRCWVWLDEACRIRMTELVQKYKFNANDIESVACSLELDELRPAFAERVEHFTPAEKQAVYAIRPHEVFVMDAIAEYGKASGFRHAEQLFEYSIRPFFGVFRAEHVRKVIETAGRNGQIWCAKLTPKHLALLFAQTQDLLTEDNISSWQGYLQKMNGIETEKDRYEELQTQMTTAGIWPPSAATAV